MLKILATSIIFFILVEAAAQTNEFIAMEYVGGIGNRILKVWVTDSLIFAAKVKGYTVESLFNTDRNPELVIPYSKRNDPNSYVNKKKAQPYDSVDFSTITPRRFCEMDIENFVICKIDIIKVYHNPKKKWGMGRYPHNGRIIIVSSPGEFNNKKEREFILIGAQDEKPILNWIKE